MKVIEFSRHPNMYPDFACALFPRILIWYLSGPSMRLRFAARHSARRGRDAEPPSAGAAVTDRQGHPVWQVSGAGRRAPRGVRGTGPAGGVRGERRGRSRATSARQSVRSHDRSLASKGVFEAYPRYDSCRPFLRSACVWGGESSVGGR